MCNSGDGRACPRVMNGNMVERKARKFINNQVLLQLSVTRIRQGQMGTDKGFLFLILFLKSGPNSPHALEVLRNISECGMSATD